MKKFKLKKKFIFLFSIIFILIISISTIIIFKDRFDSNKNVKENERIKYLEELTKVGSAHYSIYQGSTIICDNATTTDGSTTDILTCGGTTYQKKIDGSGEYTASSGADGYYAYTYYCLADSDNCNYNNRVGKDELVKLVYSKDQPINLVFGCPWGLDAIYTKYNPEKEEFGWAQWLEDSGLNYEYKESEMKDFLEESCYAEANYIKGNRIEIEKFNKESDCVTGKIIEAQSYESSCLESESEYISEDYIFLWDKYNILYYWEPGEKGIYQANLKIDDTKCSEHGINALFDYIKDESNYDKYEGATNIEDNKETLCQYIEKLYDQGKLDSNDVETLFYYNGQLNNFDKFECNIEYISNETCETNLGYSNQRKELEDSCNLILSSGVVVGCQNSNLENLSTLNHVSDGITLNVGTYTSEQGGTSIVVNACDYSSDSSWEVERLLTDLDSEATCNYLNTLAQKGLLTKKQIEEASKNDCEITVKEKGCKIKSTESGGLYYVKDGMLLSKDTYIMSCSSVFFNANGGGGLNCDNDTIISSISSDWNSCVLNKATTPNTSQSIKFPNGNGMYKLYTDNTIEYWSDKSDCTGKKYFKDQSYTFKITEEGLTFYACYKNNEIDSNIITADFDTETDVQYETCDLDLSKTAVTNKVTKQKEYNKSSTDYNLNEYCKITCVEELKYRYPNIFSTVKSGTYYEFMFNPEVIASKQCVETIDYDSWERDYKKKIEEEEDAYGQYLAAYYTYNSIPNGWPTTFTKQCGEDDIELEKWNWFRYSYSNNKITAYHDWVKDNCDEGYSDKLVSEKKDALKKYIKAFKKYISKITERKELEKYNRQCYAALDNTSDNSSSISINEYSSVNLNEDFYSLISDNTTGLIPDDIAELKFSESTNFETQYNRIGLLDIDKFYDVNPTIFYKDNSIGIEDTLSLIDNGKGNLIYDSGAYTDIEDSEYTKDKTMSEIKYNIGSEFEEKTSTYKGETSKKISDTYSISYSISFNAYNQEYILRRSQKYFEYRPSNMYYMNNNENTDGEYTTTDNCSAYGDNCIKLGYVYPINLNTTGKSNVSFSIGGTLGDIINIDYVNEKFEKLFNVSNNEFTCSYNITNDAVVKDTKNSDYKANFYTRSISTLNVDPNNRYGQGILGANWASEKGQALINIIEEKAKKNNTNSPSNLEYSFVLTPNSIRLIEEYNEGKKYTDVTLSCNSMGGECQSDFLKNYVNGKIGDNIDNDLIGMSTINNIWKYYVNSSWQTGKSINEYCVGTVDAKECYDTLYKNTGVLP